MATIIPCKAFAEMAGVTMSAIHQAIKRGAVESFQGNIDIDLPKNRAYLDAKTARDKAKHRAKHNKRAGRPRKTPKTDLPDAPPAVDGPTPGTKEYFSTQKLKAQTAKIEIEMAERLGILVPREDVKTVLGRISTVLSSQLITLGTRVAVDVAAIFGSTDQEQINKVQEFLNQDVSRVVEDLKRVIEKEFSQ